MTKIINNKNLQHEADDSTQLTNFAETQHQSWLSDFHSQEYTDYNSNSEKHIDHNPGGNVGGDDHPPVCPAPLTEYPGLTDYLISGSQLYSLANNFGRAENFCLADNFDNLVVLPKPPVQIIGNGDIQITILSVGPSVQFFAPSSTNILNGNSRDNIIVGNIQNDYIDGRLGQDTMIGGKGNDVYVIDNAKDIVIENFNEGTNDKVISTINHSLSDNIENLELRGEGNINGSGNYLNNKIKGNVGDNIINGGAGDDALRGGLGADTITGGSGSDTFLFSQHDITGNVDVITDFVSGEDHIELNAAFNFTLFFQSLLTSSNFDNTGDKIPSLFGYSTPKFSSGDGYTEAKTEGAQFFYNTSTGDLYFDGDGVGGNDAIHFATLQNAPTITVEDISVNLIYIPPCGVGDTTDYSFLVY